MNTSHSRHINKQLICQILFLGILLLCAGCSRRYSDLPAYFPWGMEEQPNESVGRFKTSYLADQIDEYFRGTDPGPLAVATFVSADDLYSTSSFGRMVAEQMMSELAMKGYQVIELRAGNSLQFRPTGGEFALSRDLNEVKHERQLGAIVTGTYVVSPVRVYLNARLIDPSTSAVLSAASVEMSKTDELKRLLRGGSVAPSLERIPVKHLGLSRYPLQMFKPEASESDLLGSESPVEPMLMNKVR